MSTGCIIAVGGFQHETNTFAPHKATFDGFDRADSWPALTRGEALFSVMDGLNIPISGFIESAKLNGHRLYPLLWCSAAPSSFVTSDAYERIVNEFCESLAAADHLDAVYLDLHGAMVVEHFEDGEGELLRRVRKIVGDQIPVILSLDLHANITGAMVKYASAITIFRTYPHLDMADTGTRAYAVLEKILGGDNMIGRMRKIPFLFPLTSQCTDFEPCRSIYDSLETVEAETPGLTSIDFACGFPPADIVECGASVVGYGTDRAVVESALDRLYQQVLDAEPEFKNELLDPDEAVLEAMQLNSKKPVVLADAQDNPGAGGTSDTTGLLEALVNNGARGAVLAILYDPEVAGQAHRAGVGATLDARLGGKSGFEGADPYQGRFRVEALGDGRFVYTGAMKLNSRAELGPMALLRVIADDADVRVIVGSVRVQCLDLAIIRHLGIEPTEEKILAVKSTVHFRADFDPIAERTLVVVAPGAHPCRLVDLAYRNLRAGVRLEPMGPEH